MSGCTPSHAVAWDLPALLSGIPPSPLAGLPPVPWPAPAETNPDGLTPHYMKGGKPGAYPTFDLLRKELGQGPLDFFDPFGFTKKMSPERKEKALLAEINNGRLAMLGLLGFCAAASVEGSVPALTGKIKHYSGEVMAPFSASDVSLPFVEKMLSYPHLPLGTIAPNF